MFYLCLEKKNKGPKKNNSEQKTNFSYVFHSSFKDLKTVIAEFKGGGARTPLYRSRWGILPPPVYALGTLKQVKYIYFNVSIT